MRVSVLAALALASLLAACATPLVVSPHDEPISGHFSGGMHAGRTAGH